MTITYGNEHDGTLYISITKPNFPEFIFYNAISEKVSVKHKDSKRPGSVFYKEESNQVLTGIKKGSKTTICLNPMEKEEDYLEVCFYLDCNKEGKKLQVKLDYEIDCMERVYTISHENLGIKKKFIIATILSGNMRFIHLMDENEYKTFRPDD